MQGLIVLFYFLKAEFKQNLFWKFYILQSSKSFFFQHFCWFLCDYDEHYLLTRMQIAHNIIEDFASTECWECNNNFALNLFGRPFQIIMDYTPTLTISRVAWKSKSLLLFLTEKHLNGCQGRQSNRQKLSNLH